MIDEFETFDKVRFYTVRFEDEDISETDKFFTTFDADPDLHEDLDNLSAFLEQMGNHFGAKSEFFRHEGSAEGLPPKEKIAREYGLVEFIDYDFRLYCMRLSDNIVVLFNGVIKSTYKNHEDPQLMVIFRMALTFSRRINDKINSKEFNLNGKQIIADELAFEY